MPNTVTYHELIGALLKTGKENHRTLILPSEHASMPMQQDIHKESQMLVLFASVFSKGRKPGSWSMLLGSSESIDDSTPGTAAERLDPVFFLIFCRKKIDYDTLHSVLM